MSLEQISHKSSKPSNRHGWWHRCLATLLATVACGTVCGADALPDHASTAVGADALHEAGITGRGVTIAVVGGDTLPGADSLIAADGHQRLLAVFDAVSSSRSAGSGAAADGSVVGSPADLLGPMLSSRSRDPRGRFQGIAPNADLVLVKALDAAGDGSVDDVVRGIEWIVANRERYGIRVLTLPLAAASHTRMSGDPLSRAVSEAWVAGIVVVAAAGNGGPEAATIAAPGDVPVVITVGAALTDPGGSVVASYSAGGPTLGGVVKPELVAPAGSAEAAAAPPAAGWVRRPSAGTSISSAIVSGVAALVLEVSPWLSADEVKRRLVASARPVAVPLRDGPSILRQGAGLVDAWAAVEGPTGRGFGDDNAESGLTWAGGSLRGLLWSDGLPRGFDWNDISDQGLLRPDTSLRGLLWSD